MDMILTELPFYIKSIIEKKIKNQIFLIWKYSFETKSDILDKYKDE